LPQVAPEVPAAATQSAPDAAPQAVPPAATPLAPRAAPPARLEAQLTRAVSQANGGATGDAELEFKQLIEAAPEFGGAAYNLGVLLRSQNKLEDSEKALAEAAKREPRSAQALTTLGLVQRERGEFAAAAASYTSALQADSGYAPAHRNLGVLMDVYLGDPAGAVDHFERYKTLTGEDRPVTSWIADVRQRSGRGREGGAPAPAPAPAAPTEAEK
jgi:lipoprotein NlpI